MTNNDQVNWDEIPEDVDAVVTFVDDEPSYYKKWNGALFVQLYRSSPFEESFYTDLDKVEEQFGDRFHLRPSPITQPTPEPPESTQVETSEVEATTTPEFYWSSVEDDVEAVIVSPLGHLMAVLKECDGVLLIGSGRGIKRMYPTRRANKVDDYPVRQLQSGDGILIRRPPATTPTEDIGLNAAYDIYKKVAAEVDKIGANSKPSISTILQEAQQSILKHHGVTGKVQFTVTCSE